MIERNILLLFFFFFDKEIYYFGKYICEGMRYYIKNKCVETLHHINIMDRNNIYLKFCVYNFVVKIMTEI